MERTWFCADTHVHIYPCYNLECAILSAYKNLSRLSRSEEAKAAALVLFLAERSDCDFFERICAKTLVVPGSVERAQEEQSCRIVLDSGKTLVLIRGRQIITAERLEVLAFGAAAVVPDGLPVQEVLQRVAREQAIPVLPWSPGKWFGGRGKLVSKLVETSNSGAFLIGDVTLRPWGWSEPLLMQRARTKGFKLVAGSDPLPFPGEERRIGSYAVLASLPYDPDRPFLSWKNYLMQSEAGLRIAGNRDLPWTLGYRLVKNYRVKASDKNKE